MEKLKLTPRQRKFCKIYLTNGFNATQAAIECGYSKKTARAMGYENLTKPHIKEFLKKLMENVEKKLDITFEKKAELLWKTAQRCYGPTDEQIEKINKGEELKEHVFEFQPNALATNVTELNKMQGHYPVKKEQEGGIVVNVTTLSIPDNGREDKGE